MTKKKIISGLLAVSLVFGSATVPLGTLNENIFADTSIEVTADSYGDFDYTVLDDGTVKISKYNGSDDSVSIPKKINGKKVTVIGSASFDETEVKSLSIPNTVKKIEGYAFQFCYDLKTVSIPNSVTTIGAGAFYGCDSLENITLPNKITKIENALFCGCDSLKSVNIPSSVTTIERYAFADCPKLRSITIPKTVTYLDFPCVGIIEETKDTNFKIKCYSGSAAHQYALEYGMKYELLDKGTDSLYKVCSTKKYTSTTNAVRIKWESVPGASGYVIYKYNSSTKKWVNLKTVSGSSTTSFKDSNLKVGTKYKYKVKAYKKTGGKTVYGDASDTITTSTKPAAVKFTGATSSQTSIRLKWNKVKCGGYEIEEYNFETKSWGEPKPIYSSTETQLKYIGLEKNQTHKYRIRAYINAGNCYVYSNWSPTKTITTKS